MKILVVDDEQDICEILQYNLETEGFEVVTAHSAEEALRLPLHEMSLILLDVMMGEMSGFQMARRLKDSPATAQIPVIFITALDGEDNLVKGLNIGADDYMAKPLSMKEVKARVRAVLRRTFAIDHSPLNIDHSLVQKEADAKNGGLQGQSYGIPTMQGGVETIAPYVDEFIEFAKAHSELTFFVTKIGCGIAGFSEAEISPLFKNAHGIANIILPRGW